MATFGDRLQELIDEKKTKPFWLARDVGLHPSIITRYLQNKPHRRNNAERIALHFGVNHDWLEHGKGPKYKTEDKNWRDVKIEEIEEKLKMYQQMCKDKDRIIGALEREIISSENKQGGGEKRCSTWHTISRSGK